MRAAGTLLGSGRARPLLQVLLLAAALVAVLLLPVVSGAPGRPTLLTHDSSGRAIGLSASIVANVTTGPAPLPIRFTAIPSGGTAPHDVFWSFGDGASSWIATPNHTFGTAGRFETNLTVRDAVGSVAASTVTIVAWALPTLSVQVTVTPPSVHPGQEVLLTASVSGGRAPYVYSWFAGPGCDLVGTGSTVHCVLNLTACQSPWLEVWVQDSIGDQAQGIGSVNVTDLPECGLATGASVQPGEGLPILPAALAGSLAIVVGGSLLFLWRHRGPGPPRTDGAAPP